MINVTEIASFDTGKNETGRPGLTFAGKDGKERQAKVSAFRFFPSSVFALILQENHDGNGLIWPPEVSPFQVHLISLGSSEEIIREAKKVFHELEEAGFEVLWDDRDKKPGVKFNDADLLGIPLRLVLGRNFLEKGQIEWEERKSGKKRFVKPDELLDNLRRFAEQG